jgi:hypothetical protein
LFGQVLDLLEEMSPEVEGSGAGTAYVGLNGHPAPPARLADEIVSGVHRRVGFMSAIGIARGKFTARIAATKARAGTIKIVPGGGEAAFLATHSIDNLPAADAIRWRLTMLGLGMIGEVARLPLGAMQAQFGVDGKELWELAHGIDNSPIIPRVHERTIQKHLELPAPAATLDAICVATERLVDECFAELQGGRWVRKATVRATLERGGAWELPVPFREALSSPENAWFAVKTAIFRSPPARPVEELEVELTGLSGESGKQATMFEGKGKLWRQVAEAIRQIDTQQGTSETQVGRVIPVEPWSRIPERRTALADYESDV